MENQTVIKGNSTEGGEQNETIFINPSENVTRMPVNIGFQKEDLINIVVLETAEFRD